LKNYDCWDDDKTPKEWLKECLGKMPPHAKCPIYDRTKQYTWANVEILDYDPLTAKFKVRVMSSQVEKWVGRLSVLFLTED
jgi:dynein heavy chain